MNHKTFVFWILQKQHPGNSYAFSTTSIQEFPFDGRDRDSAFIPSSFKGGLLCKSTMSALALCVLFAPCHVEDERGRQKRHRKRRIGNVPKN